MRHVLAALLFVAAPVAAQQNEIEGVIASQIEAFQVDDFDSAFDYASPFIQRMFRTPSNFGAMVRQGYPMVHRPDDVTYLDLDGAPPLMRQKVLIKDGAGAFFTLEYEMIEQNGTWKINGVRMLNAPSIGA